MNHSSSHPSVAIYSLCLSSSFVFFSDSPSFQPKRCNLTAKHLRPTRVPQKKVRLRRWQPRAITKVFPFTKYSRIKHLFVRSFSTRAFSLKVTCLDEPTTYQQTPLISSNPGVIVQSRFGRNPVHCVCPQCHQQIVTHIAHVRDRE